MFIRNVLQPDMAGIIRNVPAVRRAHVVTSLALQRDISCDKRRWAKVDPPLTLS
jgi:hypothetical protein